MLTLIRTHPRLAASIAVGVLAGGLMPVVWHADLHAHVLVAWSMGAVVYLLSVWHMCQADASVDSIRRRARVQAEGHGMALGLALLAIVLALVAVVTQMAAARALQGTAKGLHVALAMLTVSLAWVFIHTLFAQLYAHDYYEQERLHGQPGLAFPDTRQPGYLDFFYFAFVIATSGQTADVSFTSTRMRRTGLLHCVLAYAFNAIVLAMAINIAAGFF